MAINSLIIISAYAQTNIPLSIRDSVSRYIENPQPNLVYLGFLIIFFYGTLDWLSGMALRFVNNRYSQNIQYEIRQDIFEKLQSLDLEYYSKESIGQIMARSIQEVYSLQEILGWGYRILLLTAALFIGAFISLWLSSPTLALMFATIVPIILFVLFKSSKNNAEKFYQSQYQFGRVSEVLAENFAGIKTVKSFGREFEEINRFRKVNHDFLNAAMKVVRIRATLQPGMLFLISLSLVVLLFVGGVFTSTGVIDTGSFVAFMLLSLQIMTPGRFLGDLAIQLQMANTAARRLEEVLNEKNHIIEKPDAQEFDGRDLTLEFENVYFKYPLNKDYVLKGINLKIDYGERVALIGPTGSGKSTLINLIPRFFDPSEGRVKLGGKDIKDYKVKSIRRHVGIVHQDSFLFTLSIKDNIAFGNKDASMDEIIEAAKMAQIHEFIQTLPEGYDTVVGERGVTLSGGQRQRLAIARILLANPEIIVFDDSVSAVDPETEARLQEIISTRLGTKTLIIISQRPSSLKFVNRVIVMDDGEIVQDGVHSELVRQPGLYREFLMAIEAQIDDMVSWDSTEEEKKDRQYLASVLRDLKGGKNDAEEIRK